MAVFQNYLKPFLSNLFQFLVMLIQSLQDWEPLFALALVCLCPAGPCCCKPFTYRTRNPSLLPDNTVSARQWPLPSQSAQCTRRIVVLDPGLVNIDSFMEPSRSAGVLNLIIMEHGKSL